MLKDYTPHRKILQLLWQWIVTIQEDQPLWTAVQDKRTPEFVLAGQEQKIFFVHKKIVIPVTTEAETTVTLVAENKVHQAIGVAIHVATDVHTREETSRDTKITALENPINLITITTDLSIEDSTLDKTTVTK